MPFELIAGYFIFAKQLVTDFGQGLFLANKRPDPAADIIETKVKSFLEVEQHRLVLEELRGNMRRDGKAVIRLQVNLQDFYCVSRSMTRVTKAAISSALGIRSG